MPEPIDEAVRDYYAEQSVITDPCRYAPLFEALPSDVAALCSVIQGCMVHFLWAEHFDLPSLEERRSEILLRTVAQRLERILALDSAPLTIARPPAKRVVGLCRDYGVLLVSMLRHQNIPARERVGFAGYFDRWERDHYHCDHRITEYWDTARNRWVLVDPQIDETQRHASGLSAEQALDINTDTPFFFAGDVWLKCRAGQADPHDFGDSPTDRGMAPIRYALLHDFDALNKIELVGMDAWHELINKPEAAVTDEDKTLLDEIAKTTLHVDTRLHDLRALYAASSYGQAVRKRLATQAGSA